MVATEPELRQQVLEAAQGLGRTGLTPGRSGNVSARLPDGMLITPSGIPYQHMTLADLVIIPFGKIDPTGPRKASSESPFHRAIYLARPDVGAIVHTHSLHATVLACRHLPIPAFHYMVATAGTAEIPCIPYATFGTDALSELVADGLRHANACLMAHHGAIAVGVDCARALALAADVETLAEQYYKVLTLGSPIILPADEMARVLERFQTYGQQPTRLNQTEPQT